MLSRSVAASHLSFHGCGSMYDVSLNFILFEQLVCNGQCTEPSSVFTRSRLGYGPFRRPKTYRLLRDNTRFISYVWGKDSQRPMRITSERSQEAE